MCWCAKAIEIVAFFLQRGIGPRYFLSNKHWWLREIITHSLYFKALEIGQNNWYSRYFLKHSDTSIYCWSWLEKSIYQLLLTSKGIWVDVFYAPFLSSVEKFISYEIGSFFFFFLFHAEHNRQMRGSSLQDNYYLGVTLQHGQWSW